MATFTGCDGSTLLTAQPSRAPACMPSTRPSKGALGAAGRATGRRKRRKFRIQCCFDGKTAFCELSNRDRAPTVVCCSLMKYLIGFILLTATIAQTAASRKVYISVDMEGISGVAN